MLDSMQFYRAFLGLTLFLVNGLMLAGQEVNSPTPRSDTATVAYCDLVGNAERYSNKAVRVRGIYSSDFEKDTISAPDCYQVPAWIDFAPTYKWCTTRKLQKKMDGIKWGQSVDIVIVGRFETGRHFGHLDMYYRRLVVTCVESVQPLGNFRPLPGQKK